MVPQQLYIITNGALVLLASNIVDGILVTGEQHAVNKFLNGFATQNASLAQWHTALEIFGLMVSI